MSTLSLKQDFLGSKVDCRLRNSIEALKNFNIHSYIGATHYLISSRVNCVAIGTVSTKTY